MIYAGLKLRCPACREYWINGRLVDGTDRTPVAGDNIVCNGCAEAAVFCELPTAKLLVLRPMTVKEFTKCNAATKMRITKLITKAQSKEGADGGKTSA